MSPGKEKTIIGVMSSFDSLTKNKLLVKLFEELFIEKEELLKNFHFLFSGGTFKRIVLGDERCLGEKVRIENPDLENFLKKNSTCLPSWKDGGLIILSQFVVQRRCSILWTFQSPLSPHWLISENLALMRLCDHWRVKRLMNSGSAKEWFSKEAKIDIKLNKQKCPPDIILPAVGNIKKKCIKVEKDREYAYFQTKSKRTRYSKTFDPKDKLIALIAHDRMKDRMVEFAIDYEHELAQFGGIITTGTTGKAVADATRTLEGKMYRYQSGPKGGDIEIATEVLFNRCDVVVFFVDPLNPHPHIEDIRVVFGACMIQDEVRMLTNEMQAREWMNRIIRRR